MIPKQLWETRLQIAVAARYYAAKTGQTMRDIFRSIIHAYRHDAIQPFETVECFEDFQCRNSERIKQGVAALEEKMRLPSEASESDDVRIDGLVFGIDFLAHQRRQERNEKKDFILRCLILCEEEVRKKPLQAEFIRQRFVGAIYNGCREYRAGAKKERRKRTLKNKQNTQNNA